MEISKRAAVIGGDARAVAAARTLAGKAIECRLYGLEKDASGNCNGFTEGKCRAPYLLREALEGASVVLLPLPVSRDGKTVHTPLSDVKIEIEELCAALPRGVELFGGRLPEALLRASAEKDCAVYDLLQDEAFARTNALPTAENALALAILNYGGVLRGSSCAVLGYGNIGKILCRRLEALGAATAVFARREESRREARRAGFEAYGFEDLRGFLPKTDIVFNTVPHILLTKADFPQFKPGALYIELASAPFGISESEAPLLPCSYLCAPGLPGKFSPVYAGKIIADVILAHMAAPEKQTRKERCAK